MYRLSSIILTIIIAILSDEVAASILFNHRTNKAVSTAFRRTTNHCISRSDPTMVDRRRRHPWKDMNDCSINIWNFRTISNVQVPAPSYHRHRCLAAAAVGAATTTKKSRIREEETSLDDPEYRSLQEMRAQLGPVGRLIANSVEIGISTAGSYLSGGIFGYMVGAVMNTPGVLRNKPPSLPPPTGTGTVLPPVPEANEAGSKLMERISTLNTKSMTQAKSWGELSAAFSGFHVISRVFRGGVEDRWNSIIGSACAGAYLSRAGGSAAMMKGAMTYGGFTYMIDVFFSGDKKKTSEDGVGKEFDFQDTPVEDRGF